MLKRKTKIILCLVIIALIFLSAYLGYDYFFKEKIKKDVLNYKKEFYNGILCEYGCPLVSQEVNNKTQMLPLLDCIKDCTSKFREKYSKNNFTSQEISSDNLIKDIDANVNACKKASINLTSMKMDNVAYFNCSKSELEKLKDKYGYLR